MYRLQQQDRHASKLLRNSAGLLSLNWPPRHAAAVAIQRRSLAVAGGSPMSRHPTSKPSLTFRWLQYRPRLGARCIGGHCRGAAGTLRIRGRKGTGLSGGVRPSPRSSAAPAGLNFSEKEIAHGSSGRHGKVAAPRGSFADQDRVHGRRRNARPIPQDGRCLRGPCG